MRIPVRRRVSITEPATLVDQDLEEENKSSISTLTWVLIVFAAGLAAGAGLVFLKSKLIPNHNHTKPIQSDYSSEIYSQNPSRIFVMITKYDGQEKLVHYDTTTTAQHEIYTVSSPDDSYKLGNPRVSSDGRTVYFCEAVNKVSNILKLELEDDLKPRSAPTLLVENCTFCDYNIKRSLEHDDDDAILYLNKDEEWSLCDLKSSKSSRLLEKTTTFLDSASIHSPVLQDQKLYFMGNDSKLYKVDLADPNPEKTLIASGTFTYETVLKISPNGKWLIANNPNGDLEVFQIDGPFPKSHLKIPNIAHSFISKSGKGLYIFSADKENESGLTRIDLTDGIETFIGVYRLSSFQGMDLLEAS